MVKQSVKRRRVSKQASLRYSQAQAQVFKFEGVTKDTPYIFMPNIYLRPEKNC